MVEYILLAYYIISALYLVFNAKRKLRDFRYTAMLVVCLPIFGLVLSLLQDFAARKDTAIDDGRFKELIDKDETERFFDRVNVSKEVNLLPLEEALIVNETSTRRRLLLDVLKEDMEESMIPLLKQAVNNEDTETSHYAVTAVMEIKRKLLLSIQKWSVRYEEDKSNPEIMLEYANAIKNYTMSGFMDKRTQMSHKLNYVKLLQQLLKTEAVSEKLYCETIDSMKVLERFDEALRYSNQFRVRFPESEEAYLSELDLYYTLKMKEPFYETLASLKASKILVSNRGLNIIRYWSAKGA